jgi:hypothetical protein
VSSQRLTLALPLPYSCVLVSLSLRSLNTCHSPYDCRGLGPSLAEKRALLEPRLRELGLDILPGNGAYFLITDVRCEHCAVWDGYMRAAPVLHSTCLELYQPLCFIAVPSACSSKLATPAVS